MTIDVKKDINFMIKDAERFGNRCDIRLINILPDIRAKIELLKGTDDYNLYLNKFYEMRDGFKIDCLCGRKSRIESEETQERELETSKGDMKGDMFWFGTDLKERIEEAMKYHRGEK